jgi:DeoR/GlpR family transcriptional regulator of sugar metabolism
MARAAGTRAAGTRAAGTRGAEVRGAEARGSEARGTAARRTETKEDQLLTFDRRRQILERVNRRKSVTVDSLAGAFSVSRMTVIRDLGRLETEGLLKRVRGGAVSLAHIVVAPPASASMRALSDEQKRIALEASRRISDGDFIILESGSTCLALAERLSERDNLKIATASPVIATRLAEIAESYNRRFEIILVGGLLSVSKNFVLGPTAVQMFEHINVDLAFLSVTAIDLESGITADDVNESEVSRTILERCGRKKIGIIRSEKFNKTSFYKVADITAFDEIITDRGLDRNTAREFASRGVKMTLR